MCFLSDILLGKISGFSSQDIQIHIMFRSFYSKKNQNLVGIFVQILISLSRWKKQKYVFKIKNLKPSQYKFAIHFFFTSNMLDERIDCWENIEFCEIQTFKFSCKKIENGDMVYFSPSGKEIIMQSTNNAKILIMAWDPIDEPIYNYGPFVMNTHEEIEQAFLDLREWRMWNPNL